MFTRSRIESLTTADDLPHRLAAALTEVHSCSASGARMAPELSYGRHAGPPPVDARRAAVMVLLFRRGGKWHVPVTERPVALVRHGGQISLPGGTVDAGESSRDAALRELVEELGFDSRSQPVETLGALADCYVFASNFVVAPWLAATRVEPHWNPSPAEVARVIELPLAALLDPRNIGLATIHRGPLAFRAPCYHIGRNCIWGATSVILSGLVESMTRVEYGR